MKFVDAKCPNCGAVLKVDDSKEAAICEHCGSAFIVEKAIQQFNITNVTNNNINAQTVNIIAKEKDFVIEAGVLVKYKGESPIVHVPDNVESIDGDAWPSNIREVYLPDSITELDSHAFSDLKKLQKVVLPKSLTKIGLCCFKNSSITQIDLPESLTEIGNDCFENSSIANINLPKSLQVIGISAFKNCKNLRNITLNEGLIRIEAYAFENSGLTEVIIPASLKKLGTMAFSMCDDLTKVFISAHIECVESNAFFDNARNAKYHYCEIHCPFKKPLFGPPAGWARDWATEYCIPSWNSTLEFYELDNHC